jgi:FkbM family methyltransferase
LSGHLGSVFTGLEELDRRIAEFVTDETGTFVELGAFDGLTQSNTVYFERKGWRGVLIEPVPWNYEKCVINRPQAKVVHCACVPFGQEGMIEMTAVGLMSMVTGAMGGGSKESEWVGRGSKYITGGPQRVRVPARTLTSVLEEAAVGEISLLVLDVEGYEVAVLQGLNFDRFPPRYVVAEDQYDDQVRDYLIERGYTLVARLSSRPYTRDRLYMRLK